MSTSPDIQSLSVWLDKPAVQQAFTSLAAPILQATAKAEAGGHDPTRTINGEDHPVAGEVVIGRIKHLTVRMVIEPEGGYSGESLTHDELNAIGISDMLVDGEWIRRKEQ
ncbi:hypothetical protein KZO83_07465 [Chromohalobacter sp. TMW 2.2308]|uniref:hypothetical protein n=1 Tax=Chromohalobacter TaxID=42054 RepID=UPI001FFDB17A|nr:MULTISPECIES: hypothetical protein [Chromohalobacter]MCK2042525.1 hypothetical protein [Chromohalobacter moromii]MCT8514956.1 hypothetical protein [Chromohalobacter sp. TMW 2.2271]